MSETKLPNAYSRLCQRYPEFIDAVSTLGKTVKEQGPLDEKTAQLVQLAAAASIRSEGAVHSHTRRATEVGASEEEIHQALLLLTSTIGLPTVVAALSWADDILEPLE